MSADGTAAGVGKATPIAAIFGCSGIKLTAAEKRFFGDARALGLILFARNCREPEQLSELIAAFREAVGRADAPVLIDQEGGRVQRLNPPHWRAAPAATAFASLARRDQSLAVEAVNLNAQLIAADLADLGITVNCAPVLDVPQPDAHRIIGDRAFGGDAKTVATLGTAACEGFLAHGVLPVIKHIPGHGRARADSHQTLPRVAADEKTLVAVDFAPFRALRGMPWAMSAHVVYEALDRDHPATTSAPVIAKAIRGTIGFDGVLVSDDIGMKALTGPFEERAASALAAGCDVVLHCSGEIEEMRAVAAGAGAISTDAAARLRRGEDMRRKPGAWDRDAAKARLDEIMAASAMA
jgi:beta-N-acetylhexosaminidase